MVHKPKRALYLLATDSALMSESQERLLGVVCVNRRARAKLSGETQTFCFSAAAAIAKPVSQAKLYHLLVPALIHTPEGTIRKTPFFFEQLPYLLPPLSFL